MTNSDTPDDYDPHFYHPLAELIDDDGFDRAFVDDGETEPICWCCDDTGTSYQGVTPCPRCHRSQETAS